MKTADDVTVHLRVDVFGEMDMVRARRRHAPFPAHMHEEFVLALVDAGRVRTEYRGAVHRARAGDVVVIHPGETHTGESDDGMPWGYRAIYPSADLLARASEDAGHGNRVPHFPSLANTNPVLAQEFRKLYVVLERAYCPLKCETVLAEFLVRLVQQHGGSGESATRIGDAPRSAVQQAREFMDAHYGRPLTLRELSAAVGVGEFKLIRAFRASFGLPPFVYLVQQRIGHAKRLLRAGEPVSSVAYQTGFCDQSHLTRHFRRIVGVTPGLYARRTIVPAACAPDDHETARDVVAARHPALRQIGATSAASLR